jgi:hypothetical protein
MYGLVHSEIRATVTAPHCPREGISFVRVSTGCGHPTGMIPASVRTLSAEAFYDCRSLHSVEFESESQLTTIEANAFSNCLSFGSICLPGSLERIDGSVLCGSSLSAVQIDGRNSKLGIRDRFIVDWSGNRILLCFDLVAHLTIPVDILELSRCSFSRGPAGGKSIWDQSPVPSLQLRSILIPSSVGRFGLACFYRCDALSSIEFDASSRLNMIEEGAFCGCSSLCCITLPASVLTLSKAAFADCSKLRSVSFELGSRLAQIGDRAFLNCCSLSAVSLPPLIHSLSADSFEGCDRLREIRSVSEAVVEIRPSIFCGCPVLTSVFLPVKAEILLSQGGMDLPE